MELNHLAAILHVYGGGLNFMKLKKIVIIFQKNYQKCGLIILLILQEVVKKIDV